MKKVIIFQDRLLHYRINLFQKLREECFIRGIELYLVHGQASRREFTRRDEGTLPWACKVNNRYWEIGQRDIVWQSFPAVLKDSDLVVLMQENRNLSNYQILLSQIYSSRKVAYWGHAKIFRAMLRPGCVRSGRSFC